MTTSERDGEIPGPQSADLAARGSRTAYAGLLFSALFLVAWLIVWDSPSFDDTDARLIDYYSDPDRRRMATIAGLYVIPLAGIAFIWFMAALRDRYARTARSEHVILSTAQGVSGALVVASLFSLAAVELAAAWLAEQGNPLDVDGIRSLLALGQASSDIMALRSAAVFIGVSTSRAVRSGLFPRAFGAVSFVVAAALLFVSGPVPVVSLLFPAWVAGSAVLILVNRRFLAPAEQA